jgi:hypothetical protein
MPTIGDLVIKMSTQLDALQQGFQQAESAAQKTTSQMESMFERAGSRISGILQNIGTMAAGYFSVQGLWNLAQGAWELVRVAERWDVPVQRLAEIKVAAEKAGTSLQRVMQGSEKLASVIVEASEGGQAAVSALGRVGLSWEQLITKSPAQAMLDVMDKIAEKASAIERIGMYRSLFGRGGAELALVGEKLGGLQPGEVATGGAIEDAAAAAERAKELGRRLEVAVIALAAAIERILEHFQGGPPGSHPNAPRGGPYDFGYFGHEPPKPLDVTPEDNAKIQEIFDRSKREIEMDARKRLQTELTDQSQKAYGQLERTLQRRLAEVQDKGGMRFDIETYLQGLTKRGVPGGEVGRQAEGLHALAEQIEAAEAAKKAGQEAQRAEDEWLKTWFADFDKIGQEEQKWYDETGKRAQKFYEESRTPLQKYLEALEEINAYWQSGWIGEGTAGRAGLHAQREYVSDYERLHPRRDNWSHAGEFGSAEAYRSLYSALFGDTASRKDQALEEAKKHTISLNDLVTLMRIMSNKQGIPLEPAGLTDHDVGD